MKSVDCILFKGNSVLLQKRTLDYEPAPGYWTLFGGHLQENEEPEVAIKREIKEELGINLTEHQHSWFFGHEDVEAITKGVKSTSRIYACQFAESLDQLKLTEGAGFGLFKESEIDHYLIPTHQRTALANFYVRVNKEIADVKSGAVYGLEPETELEKEIRERKAFKEKIGHHNHDMGGLSEPNGGQLK